MTLTIETGRQIAEQFTEQLWNKGDLSVAEQILSSDFIDHDPVSGQKPGRDGYKEMVSVFRTGFPDLQVKNEDVIVEANGDRVVVRWTAHGTIMVVF
jgi:predicted ester cyclase